MVKMPRYSKLLENNSARLDDILPVNVRLSIGPPVLLVIRPGKLIYSTSGAVGLSHVRIFSGATPALAWDVSPLSPQP